MGAGVICNVVGTASCMLGTGAGGTNSCTGGLLITVTGEISKRDGAVIEIVSGATTGRETGGDGEAITGAECCSITLGRTGSGAATESRGVVTAGFGRCSVDIGTNETIGRGWTETTGTVWCSVGLLRYTGETSGGVKDLVSGFLRRSGTGSGSRANTETSPICCSDKGGGRRGVRLNTAGEMFRFVSYGCGAVSVYGTDVGALQGTGSGQVLVGGHSQGGHVTFFDS